MTDRLRLRPAKGLRVRHEPPRRDFVDEDGEEVSDTSYYRRLRDAGDLERAPAPRKQKED